jgi:hypothetical protein
MYGEEPDDLGFFFLGKYQPRINTDEHGFFVLAFEKRSVGGFARDPSLGSG